MEVAYITINLGVIDAGISLVCKEKDKVEKMDA